MYFYKISFMTQLQTVYVPVIHFFKLTYGTSPAAWLIDLSCVTHITEHLTLLGIMLLERLSTGFGERVSNHCYSTARVCLFLFCCLCESYFFWQKMFYSDNLLLSVLARSCKESAVAVADAYNISVFDLLHLDSSWAPVLRMFSGIILLLLLICTTNEQYEILIVWCFGIF